MALNSFETKTTGDVILASDVNELHNPIYNLERNPIASITRNSDDDITQLVYTVPGGTVTLDYTYDVDSNVLTERYRYPNTSAPTIDSTITYTYVGGDVSSSSQS